MRLLSLLLLVLVGPSACATAGTTLGSGVGDTFLERPPYYAGAGATGDGARIGHLPVAYQRGASQAAIFDPSDPDSMVELLSRMTAYLDSAGRSVRLVEDAHVSAVSHRATRVPPDVQFGCVTETGIPDDECAIDGDTVLGRSAHRLRLAVGRPAPEWAAWMNQVLDATGTDRALVVTLEVGQYLPRQRGWRGSKEIELGTCHVQELPWLTSLETPVSVIQLTGALVGRDGKSVRIGAEGLLARRTPIALSGLGAQALITEDDVLHLATLRRNDLPGRPLVWEAGLRSLIAHLTGPLGSPGD